MDLKPESFILAETLANPNRMTLVSDNIRYLRKLNGLTQEQFSRKISIKRSLLGAYEEGRANPNQQNIQAIAKAFNTTIELLTRQDLRKLRETPSLSIPLGQRAPERSASESGSSIRSDGKLSDDDDPFQHPDFPDIFAQPDLPAPEPRPLAQVLNKYYKTLDEARREPPIPPVITAPVRPGQSGPAPERPQPTFYQAPRPAEPLAFNNVYEGSAAAAAAPVSPMLPTIPVVMQRQFAEYGQHYRQADYLHRFPTMYLPNLPEGQFRAFEAGDDFAFPGALLVGKFIRNWFDIADGELYVLLVQQPTGATIRCRRVYNQVKVKSSLLLTADRTDLPNMDVLLKDVLEVWEVCAFVSQKMPDPAPNTDRLRQLVNEIKFEVERL